MALTDTAIRKAKPAAKAYKLKDGAQGSRDGGGLYLLIQPNGSKLWRLDYRRPVTSKPNTLSLGTYPEVGIADARSKRDSARRQLAQGIDPSAARKAHKAAQSESAANSFNALADEWLALQTAWVDSHRAKQASRLDSHVRPYIGERPISDITVGEIRPILKRLVDEGTHEQAHRVLAITSSVFRYPRAQPSTASLPNSAFRWEWSTA